MQVTLTPIRLQQGPKPVEIGPRTRTKLQRRVRELEARFKPTPKDLRELATLKELLKSVGPASTRSRSRSASGGASSA